MKNIKKLISLLLCFALLISSAVMIAGADDGAAAEPAKTSYGSQAEDYPVIFVTGIGQSYSYLYSNEEDAKADVEANETDRAIAKWNLFCNDFSFALKEPAFWINALSVLGTFLFSALTDHNFVNKKAVDNIVSILFRYNTVDENGELPPVVVTPRMYYPVSQYTEEQKDNFYRTIPCQDVIGDIGEDYLYCFNYSAFSDTYKNAATLNSFINDTVLKQTGKEKVVLIPMSMGASVVSAYLQDYGTLGKVARVVSIVGAWNGSDVFADLIEQKYSVDAPELLYNGIVSELVGEPWGYLVNVALRIFPKAVLRSIIDEILGSIVDNLVLKTPSLAALIPHERYQQIRKDKLEGNEKFAYVMKTADKYYLAQSGLQDTMNKLNEECGTEFYFLAGYGLKFGGFSSDYKFFQFLESADTTNSDEIIQVSSTVPGASFVKAGESFDESYVSSHDAAYISPDKSVDISTSFFPEKAWLFRGQKHELEYNNTALRLALDLALAKITGTNDENNIYPRFNDSRDLKPLNRSYRPDLAEWMKDNKLSDEQKALLDKNEAAVTEMENSVINNREADDKLIADYRQMLISFGVYGPDGDDEPGFAAKLLKGLNDKVYEIFGAKGFADIFRK